MSGNWTFGPWEWVLMGSEGGVVRATGRGLTAKENKAWRDAGNTPDIVKVRYGSFEQLQANGQLIAAAPDLFDALEAFVDGYGYTDEELRQLADTTSGRGEIPPEQAKKLINGRAALALARGGE